MPFKNIKGARSSGVVRQLSNNQSDCASNQSNYWTLEFNLELVDGTVSTLFAKTKKERHLWIDGFSKAVELSNNLTPLKALRQMRSE